MLTLLELCIEQLLKYLPKDVIEKLVKYVWDKLDYYDIRTDLCRRKQLPGKIQNYSDFDSWDHKKLMTDVVMTDDVTDDIIYKQLLYTTYFLKIYKMYGTITFQKQTLNNQTYYIPIELIQTSCQNEPYNIVTITNSRYIFKQKFITGIIKEKYRIELCLIKNRNNAYTLIEEEYNYDDNEWISGLPLRVKFVTKL